MNRKESFRNHLRPEIPLRACFVRLHHLVPYVNSGESTTQTIASLIATFKSRLRKVEDPDIFFTHVNEDDFISDQLEHAKRVIERKLPQTPSTRSISSIGTSKSERKRPFWNKSMDISGKRSSVRSVKRKRKKKIRRKKRNQDMGSTSSNLTELDDDERSHLDRRSNNSSKRYSGFNKEKPLFKKIIPITKRPETRKRMAMDLEISNVNSKQSIPLRVFVDPDDSHNLQFFGRNQSPVPSTRSSLRPNTSSGRRGVNIGEDDVNLGSRRSSISTITSSQRPSSRRGQRINSQSSISSNQSRNSRGKMISIKNKNNSHRSIRNSQFRRSIQRPNELDIDEFDNGDGITSSIHVQQPYFNVEVEKRRSDVHHSEDDISGLLLETSHIVQRLQNALATEQEKKEMIEEKKKKNEKKKRRNKKRRKFRSSRPSSTRSSRVRNFRKKNGKKKAII